MWGDSAARTSSTPKLSWSRLDAYYKLAADACSIATQANPHRCAEMEGGGAHNYCPVAIRTAAHPHHELVHTHLRNNECNLCRQSLRGEFGYRCNACDFDIHCRCLPADGRTQSRSTVQAGAAAHAARPPPPATVQQMQPMPHADWSAAPPPRPSSSSLWARPRLYLSLSPQFTFQHHTHGTQASVVDPSHTQNYPAPRHNYEPGTPTTYNHLQQQNYDPNANNYGYETGAEHGAPATYNHLPQQNYDSNAHNYGYETGAGYMDHYNEATDNFEDVDDYDGMDD